MPGEILNKGLKWPGAAGKLAADFNPPMVSRRHGSAGVDMP